MWNLSRGRAGQVDENPTTRELAAVSGGDWILLTSFRQMGPHRCKRVSRKAITAASSAEPGNSFAKLVFSQTTSSGL